MRQIVEEQAKKIFDSFSKELGDHSKRVAEIAVAIAQGLGLPQDDIEKVKLAGLTHDIGMMEVGESVLSKHERLTEAEYRHLTYHSEMGERILASMVKDKSILKMVKHHHERYDGGGYPDGLRGEQIPLGARILALAEAYDAMVSGHPYREAMSPEDARADIVFCTGTQFDPNVANVFLGPKLLQ